MNTLLLIIDLQNAFINENTKHIVKKIDNLIKENKYDNVIFTRFINSCDNILYKKLNYKNCITEESRNIVIDTLENKIFDKNIYTAYNEELISYIKNNNIDRIFICGIDTECCVLKTTLDLFENGYDVNVLKDYCASTIGVKRHNRAIEILKRNIGKNNIKG